MQVRKCGADHLLIHALQPWVLLPVTHYCGTAMKFFHGGINDEQTANMLCGSLSGQSAFINWMPHGCGRSARPTATPTCCGGCAGGTVAGCVLGSWALCLAAALGPVSLGAGPLGAVKSNLGRCPQAVT